MDDDYDDYDRLFGRPHLVYYDEIEPEPLDDAARLAYMKEVTAGMEETPAHYRPSARRLTLVRRRLEELLLLDTNRASAASVAAHLERYADAAARADRRAAPTPTPPPPPRRIDGGAALAALPDDLQLAVLRHLSDYDVVALLASRKTPCVSETTCANLHALLFQGPPPPDAVPEFARGIYNLDKNEPPPRWFPAFPVDRGPYTAYDEFRRCSYLRGSVSQYAIFELKNRGAINAFSEMKANYTFATPGGWDTTERVFDPKVYCRYESADVPGDTVRVSEVATRLVGFLPDNVKLARLFAKDRWQNGRRPRWQPPLVRVTEQGNPTDGRVGEFVCKCV